MATSSPCDIARRAQVRASRGGPRERTRRAVATFTRRVSLSLRPVVDSIPRVVAIEVPRGGRADELLGRTKRGCPALFLLSLSPILFLSLCPSFCPSLTPRHLAVSASSATEERDVYVKKIMHPARTRELLVVSSERPRERNTENCRPARRLLYVYK